MPPYAMYGIDGDVTAEVVYANYALPEDFAQLERMGISVTGKIVLSRAGPHSRAVKASQAALHGALGLVMYNDPKEDGYWLGPRLPARPDAIAAIGRARRHSRRRGLHGRSIESGLGDKPGAKRLPLSEARGLSKIPVLSISYGDATQLFELLEGPVVPSDSWKGALGIAYLVGPSKTKVHMKVRSEWKDRALYDVIARIPGASHPNNDSHGKSPRRVGVWRRGSGKRGGTVWRPHARSARSEQRMAA